MKFTNLEVNITLLSLVLIPVLLIIYCIITSYVLNSIKRKTWDYKIALLNDREYVEYLNKNKK